MALGEAEVGEGGQLVEDLLGHLAGDAPLGHAGEEPVAQPLHALAGLRLEPMAWRSWSASAGVNPATSMAICMSCSWNSGTPRVLARAGSQQRVEVGDRLLVPLRRRM